MITTDEYKRYLELSSFKCPINRERRLCDGKICPVRPEPVFNELWNCQDDDYFDECIESRYAELIVHKVAVGKIQIKDNKINGWEIKLEQ